MAVVPKRRVPHWCACRLLSRSVIHASRVVMGSDPYCQNLHLLGSGQWVILKSALQLALFQTSEKNTPFLLALGFYHAKYLDAICKIAYKPWKCCSYRCNTADLLASSFENNAHCSCLPSTSVGCKLNSHKWLGRGAQMYMCIHCRERGKILNKYVWRAHWLITWSAGSQAHSSCVPLGKSGRYAFHGMERVST